MWWSRRAALWLVFLGPFFFLTYGAANAWTARLPLVPSIVFEWEMALPFVPWLMLPYMSIDLFYAASLFLFKDKGALDTHAKRLLLATLLSVAGFLLFPLQASFTRPAIEGFGAAFNQGLLDALLGFDKPFNQLPSLHISLLIILWVAYAPRCTGGWRAALDLWFGLIAVSVVGTYQHHVVDVLGGAVVGVLCLYLVPDAGSAQSISRATPRHRQLAARYGIGALLATSAWAWCAQTGQVWIGLLFTWTALSLALLTLAYLRVGAAVFQKRDGRLSVAARFLLAPYLLGAMLSRKWFARQIEPWKRVAPGVLQGRLMNDQEATTLIHIAPELAVIDLTAEYDALPRLRRHTKAYLQLPVMDLTAPHPAQLARAVDFIKGQRALGRTVLVHCALGIGRSGAVVNAS